MTWGRCGNDVGVLRRMTKGASGMTVGGFPGWMRPTLQEEAELGMKLP